MKAMTNAFVVVNEKFNFVEGNREVNDECHIRKIMNAMMNGEFVPPIIVDRTTRIVTEGQHRYVSAVNLWKMGIPYELGVIFSDFENPLLEAIKYNNNSKAWKTSTFINAYIADKRESYILLKRFCETHELLGTKNKFKYSTAITLLTHSHDSEMVKNGTLVVTQEQCAQAEIVYQEMSILFKHIPAITQKTILSAWINSRATILQKVNFNVYIKMLEQKLVAPAAFRTSEWENAFIKVLL
jgi:hypothetical protein